MIACFSRSNSTWLLRCHSDMAGRAGNTGTAAGGANGDRDAGCCCCCCDSVSVTERPSFLNRCKSETNEANEDFGFSTATTTTGGRGVASKDGATDEEETEGRRTPSALATLSGTSRNWFSMLARRCRRYNNTSGATADPSSPDWL